MTTTRHETLSRRRSMLNKVPEVTLWFWIAYILTRPLGANIGDYLGSAHADGGVGLGTFGTSVLFLGTITAVVAYRTRSEVDRIELVRVPAE